MLLLLLVLLLMPARTWPVYWTTCHLEHWCCSLPDTPARWATAAAEGVHPHVLMQA
jgi:hypothetical protein